VHDSEALPRPRPTVLNRLAARWRRDLVFFLIAVAVVTVDQWTKWLVRSNLGYLESGWELGPIRIIHVVNSGAAFGILQGQTPFLIVMSMFGLAAIVLYYVYPPMDHGIIRVALGLQLGGAMGNLIDRVRLGEVTDYIDVGSFPVFNVADSAISVSIVVVLGFFLLQEFEEKETGDRGQGTGSRRDHRTQAGSAASVTFDPPSAASDAGSRDD
jgi:signal peptidase II